MKNINIAMGLAIAMSMSTAAKAISVTGADAHVDVNNGAYIDATSTAPSSAFAKEIISMGNETMSGSILFSQIPYFDFNSTRYFQFVFDMQETGGNSGGGIGGRSISLDDIVVSVNGTAYWDYDQITYGSILLNTTTPFTNTPLGAGGDMDLYIPVSLFTGYGLTGADSLTLTVTQSDSDNGKDEWIVLSSGSFFATNEVITTPQTSAVPVPAPLALLGSGLLALVQLARRRAAI